MEIAFLPAAANALAAIPVRWQPLPGGATDRPGEVVVTGTTALGTVTAVIDVV